MSYLSLFLIILPVLAALYGLVIFIGLPYEGGQRRVLRLLAAEAFVYFVFVTITLLPEAPASWVVVAQLGNGLIGPFIEASFICLIYLRFHQDSRLPQYMNLWFALPLAFFVVSVTLCWVAGYSNVTYFRYMCDLQRDMPGQYANDRVLSTIYSMNKIQSRVLLGAYIICMIAYGVSVLRRTHYSLSEYRGFCRRGGKMKTQHIAVICLLQIVVFVLIALALGRYVIFDHPWVAGILHLMIAYNMLLFVQANRFCDRESVTMRQLFLHEPVSEVYGLSAESVQMACKETGETSMQTDNPELLAQLAKKISKAFDEDQLYLQQGLKVSDLARQVSTNRLYVSRAINEMYGMPFNEIVARYRIKYAKQRMQNNQFDTIDHIAILCGFRSAQAFSRKFKEIEGMPPSEWYTKVKNK